MADIKDLYTQGMETSLLHNINTTQPLLNATLDSFLIEKHSVIVNIMLMILSFFGNMYIIVFICKQKRARNAHNISLVSIAVADLVICVIVIPSYIAVHNSQPNIPTTHPMITPFLCKIYKYLFYWCKTVKIYSVVAMAIDRYYRITMPTQNANLSGRCIFFLTLIWFFGSAFNVWQLILNTFTVRRWEGLESNLLIRSCVSASHFHFLQTGFVISTLLVTYLLPFLSLTYCYAVIFQKYYTHTDRLLPLKSKRRLLISILSALVFYMCQLPAEVLHYKTANVEEVSLWLVTLGSIFESLAFSQGALNVVCCLCCSTELRLPCASSLTNLPYCNFPRDEPQHERPHTSNYGQAVQILVTSGSNEALNHRQ